MRIRVQVIIEQAEDSVSETVGAQTYDIASLERAAGEVTGPETLGLTLAEAKTILRGVQQVVVAAQAAAHVEARRRCPACGTPLRLKGYHQTQFRTLFGTIPLTSPRLFRCRCQALARAAPEQPEAPASAGSFSPLAELLLEHVAPERLYLEAKWAALVSGSRHRKMLLAKSGCRPNAVRELSRSRAPVCPNRHSGVSRRDDAVTSDAIRCV